MSRDPNTLKLKILYSHDTVLSGILLSYGEIYKGIHIKALKKFSI